ELEPASRVARTHPQRRLESARGVGGAPCDLEGLGGAAGVAGGGERLARLEVGAEPREQGAGVAPEAARRQITGGAQADLAGQGLADCVDGLGSERVVPAERGEV